MTQDRRSFTVWLKSRHQNMLDAMPGVSLSDITRTAIEELFEGRNEKEYARLCLQEDVSSLLEKWKAELGLTGELTLTATEDGFRLVVVALKKYGSAPKPVTVERPTAQKVEVQNEVDFDEWVDQED